MLNLLIIEDDVKQLRNITNIIAKNFSEIRICGISFDGEQALSLIEELNVDIILLDLKLSFLSGVDIINYIEKQNMYQYKNSIIVLSGEMNLIMKIKKSEYLFSYVIKGNGFDLLLKELDLLISLKNDSEIINNKVDIELKKLNYNFSYNGTKYLRDTIIEIYKIKDKFEGNLTKNIYPKIAKKYNKRINTIYCDIKQATNSMILECDEKILNKYLRKSYFSKPKIMDIIYAILNKL